MKHAYKSAFILFVDDDPEDFEIFREAFEQVNPDGQVVHHRDCDRALEFLRSNAEPLPDYIFLDVNMPTMTGEECLKLLKADPDLKKIPVIMYTTSVGPYEELKYRNMGATHSFEKPTRFPELVKLLRDLG